MWGILGLTTNYMTLVSAFWYCYQSHKIILFLILSVQSFRKDYIYNIYKYKYLIIEHSMKLDISVASENL